GPALLLKFMPPFSDCLICGISSQLHQEVVDFDEIIDLNHPDFQGSGLKTPPVIRLGFLTVIPKDKILGVIGQASQNTYNILIQRLINYLSDD
ncbi:MAG: transcriptional regulator, partial [Spirochaetota bacterium]|nr:transcriptional regulator [Spirochaetota bacterium]